MKYNKGLCISFLVRVKSVVCVCVYILNLYIMYLSLHANTLHTDPPQEESFIHSSRDTNNVSLHLIDTGDVFTE